MSTERAASSPTKLAANQISGISSMAVREMLAYLAREHERLSGCQVHIESVGGVDALRRVQDGEPFDVVVLASDAIDRLAASGHIDPGARVDLARSNVAIAVAAGSPQPDISTEEAVRHTVLGARSIAYSTGPSGAHLIRLIERWGIEETIASRLVKAPPGVPAGKLVIQGNAEIAFQQLSELMDLPGVDVIGCLPPEMSCSTVFSIATCTTSVQPQVARALQSFLSSPMAVATKRKFGMEAI